MRVAIALAAGVIASVAGCRVNRPPNNHALTQTMFTSTLGDPRTFNPILVTDSTSGQAIGDMFEGLVRINPITTLPEPGLAERWELGEGGKTITFHLRRGVKWSDGEPFTAHDVLFTMRVIYDPKIPNSSVFSMTVDGQPIKVEAPDDYTVVMRMPRPFAPLFYSIGFGIIPAHVLETIYKAGQFNHAWGIDTPPDKLISIGAYQMDRYVAAQQIAFRRYPHYWMHDEHGAQLPRLRGQVLLIVPDQNTQYLRFKAGLTDVYAPRPEEVYGLHEDAKRLNITLKRVGIDTGSLFFAFNRNPRHYLQKGVTDPRYKWFVTNYGHDCWELDAMDPNDLRNCVEAAIKELIEPVAWARCELVNAAEKENIHNFLGTYKKWDAPDWIDEFLQASTSPNGTEGAA